MRVPDKWYAARKCVKGEDAMDAYAIGTSTHLPVERIPVLSKGLAAAELDSVMLSQTISIHQN